PALLALLVGFASVGPVGGQETGEPASPAVDELRGLARVAGQKLEAEVRDRLREAERLAESDRPQAAQRLRKLLGRLEGDLTLSEERRDRLTRMLRDRLRVVTSPPATEV